MEASDLRVMRELMVFPVVSIEAISLAPEEVWIRWSRLTLVTAVMVVVAAASRVLSGRDRCVVDDT